MIRPKLSLRFSSLIGWILILVAVQSAAAWASDHARKRPNFLVIVVDDQSPFDLKLYNPESTLETPTLDRIAARGVTLRGAYHMGSFAGAVCTPSRHMIMSGRSLWHLPISPGAKSKGLCPEHLERETLAAVFNRAGYQTMRTCKLGNSYEAANQQFQIRKDATKRGTTDEDGSPWHAEQVLNFLDTRETDKPFLIYLGFSHPHDTRDGNPVLLEKYGAVNHADKRSLPSINAKTPKLPINYLPAHPFPHGHPNLRDEVSVSGVWARRDEATIRNELGRQYACSEWIDQQIDRVWQRLEQIGELENTYILYTSDHGIAIGRHGLQGKQNLYQHTWQVPLVVCGPGIPKMPAVRRGNVYLMDLLATLTDLAGIPTPPTNEGLSFVPVLEGKRESMRDVMYGVYCGGTKPGIRAIQKEDWKLIEYDVLDGKVRETQLFHLGSNPHEFLDEHTKLPSWDSSRSPEGGWNLARQPSSQDKIKELRSLLQQEMDRWNDPYPLWNQSAGPEPRP